MELQDMLKVSPSDYLRQGFLTTEGKLRDRINGENSLAIAYQTREEGVDLDRFQHVIQQIDPSNADVPALREKIQSLQSPALNRVLQASEPWFGDSRQYVAFVSHLRRIMSQLALLILTPVDASTDENR